MMRVNINTEESKDVRNNSAEKPKLVSILKASSQRRYTPDKGASNQQYRREITIENEFQIEMSNQKPALPGNNLQYLSMPMKPSLGQMNNIRMSPSIKEDTYKSHNNSQADEYQSPIPKERMGTDQLCYEPSFRVSTQERSSIMDMSMIQEMRNWEKLFEIDHQLTQKIEQNFEDIEFQLRALETEFDVSLNLSQQIDTKYMQLLTVMRGANFIKFSRKNQKNSHSRFVYYCPSLDALCWKSPKNQFPQSHQLINIKDITNIYGSYQRFNQTNKTYNLSSCKLSLTNFLALETQDEQFLLIAESAEIQSIFVKVLNTLVNNSKKSKVSFLAYKTFNNSEKEENQQKGGSQKSNHEFFFLENQYNQDIGKIKKEIDSAKILFSNTAVTLRKSFFETTQVLIKQERKQSRMARQKATFADQKEFHFDELEAQNIQFKQVITHLEAQNAVLSKKNMIMENDQYLVKEGLQKLLSQVQDFLHRKDENGSQKQLYQNNEGYDDQDNDALRSMNLLRMSVEHLASIFETQEGKLINVLAEFKHISFFSEENSRKCEELNSQYQLLLLQYNQILNQKSFLFKQDQDNQDQIKQLKEAIQESQSKEVQTMQQFEHFCNMLNDKEIQFENVVNLIRDMRDDLLREIQDLQSEILEDGQKPSLELLGRQLQFISLTLFKPDNQNRHQLKFMETQLREKESTIKKMHLILEGYSDKTSNINCVIMQKDAEIEKLKNINEQILSQTQSLRCELSQLKLKLKHFEMSSNAHYANSNTYNKTNQLSPLDDDYSNKENIPSLSNGNNIQLYKNDRVKILEDRNHQLEEINNNSLSRHQELEAKILNFEKMYQEQKGHFDIVNQKLKSAQEINSFLQQNLDDTKQAGAVLIALFLLWILESDDLSDDVPLKLLSQKAIKYMRQNSLSEVEQISNLIEKSVNSIAFSEGNNDLVDRIKTYLKEWRQMVVQLPQEQLNLQLFMKNQEQNHHNFFSLNSEQINSQSTKLNNTVLETENSIDEDALNRFSVANNHVSLNQCGSTSNNLNINTFISNSTKEQPNTLAVLQKIHSTFLTGKNPASAVTSPSNAQLINNFLSTNSENINTLNQPVQSTTNSNANLTSNVSLKHHRNNSDFTGNKLNPESLLSTSKANLKTNHETQSSKPQSNTIQGYLEAMFTKASQIL